MKLSKPQNLGLHILALILAIVLYHALKPDSAPTQSSHDRLLFQYR